MMNRTPRLLPQSTTQFYSRLTQIRWRNYTNASKFLRVSEEVRDAVNAGKPVVSLETTIYTHGFPYPENVELSNHLESIVRRNGAVPATVGVLHGVARVGMTSKEMEELLRKASKGWQTIKLSRRDLGWICGQGMLGNEVNGGTTIAGTLALSHLAGIKIFATGGLGGVHKGGESSMDVSADLTELGRTPVALISSGCKSFLDIPRTLEYLETQGVGVGTFSDGRLGSVDFPAFWTRDSGIPSPRTILNEQEAAAIIHAQFRLPLSSGLLFANPIAENFSLTKSFMEEVMTQAVKDAEAAGAIGHANTPFVLGRIRDLTGGDTIKANRELVAANVSRGAKVACELARLDRNADTPLFRPTLDADRIQKTSSRTRKSVDLVIAGCAALDVSGDYTGPKSTVTLHTSNPGKFNESVGGVGMNVSRAASYVNSSMEFCSVVGDDSDGRFLLDAMEKAGLSSSYVKLLHGQSSGRYIALNDSKKDMFVAMADMSIMESTESDMHTSWKTALIDLKPKWLGLDANWDSESLSTWINAANDLGIKIAFEPVSEEKSARLFTAILKDRCRTPITRIDLATPNASELTAMKEAVISTQSPSNSFTEDFAGEIDDVHNKIGSALNYTSPEAIKSLLGDALTVIQSVRILLVTMGKDGALLTEDIGDDTSTTSKETPEGGISQDFLINGKKKRILFNHYPIPEKIHQSEIKSVNGVGDTFFGVLLAGLAMNCQLDGDLINIAQRAAALTLQSSESVSSKVQRLSAEVKALARQ